MKLSKRNNGSAFWSRVQIGEHHKYAVSTMSGSCVAIQAKKFGYTIEIIGGSGDFKITGRKE